MFSILPRPRGAVQPTDCLFALTRWQAMREVREAHNKDAEEIALMKDRLKEEEVCVRPPPGFTCDRKR